VKLCGLDRDSPSTPSACDGRPSALGPRMARLRSVHRSCDRRRGRSVTAALLACSTVKRSGSLSPAFFASARAKRGCRRSSPCDRAARTTCSRAPRWSSGVAQPELGCSRAACGRRVAQRVRELACLAVSSLIMSRFGPVGVYRCWRADCRLDARLVGEVRRGWLVLDRTCSMLPAALALRPWPARSVKVIGAFFCWIPRPDPVRKALHVDPPRRSLRCGSIAGATPRSIGRGVAFVIPSGKGLCRGG